MKFSARIGAITTASIVACGSLGAAQPAEQTSPLAASGPTQDQPTHESDPSDTASTPQSPLPPQPPQPSDTQSPTEQPTQTETSPDPSPSDEGTSSPLENMTCEVISADDTTAVITLPNAEEGDVVMVGGATKTIDANARIQVTAQDGASLELKLERNGDVFHSECEVTIGPGDTESPSEPSDPSDDNSSSHNPTTPPPETPSPPDPTTGTTTPTEEPSDETSGNGSGNTPVPEPVPSTTPPAPSTPRDQTSPAQPVPPPTGSSSRHNANVPGPAAPSTPPSSATPSGRTDRTAVDMRQYSDNPQYQLPQLWRTETSTGSRLIMPEPRDAGVQEPELETLPPVSDDELDAIKARLSSPDHGNRLHSDDEHVAGDSDSRFSGTGSWWVFSGIIGVIVLGTGIWWTISRRKPKH